MPYQPSEEHLDVAEDRIIREAADVLIGEAATDEDEAAMLCGVESFGGDQEPWESALVDLVKYVCLRESGMLNDITPDQFERGVRRFLVNLASARVDKPGSDAVLDMAERIYDGAREAARGLA